MLSGAEREAERRQRVARCLTGDVSRVNVDVFVAVVVMVVVVGGCGFG